MSFPLTKAINRLEVHGVAKTVVPSPLDLAADGPSSIISPTEKLLSLNSTTSYNVMLIAEQEMGRLTDSYALAFADFYGSGTPCVFKSGPAWPIPELGPEMYQSIRAARLIYDDSIAPIWLDTVWAIVALLDERKNNWNTVDPLTYANAGETALICEFVITIGVLPGSLAYSDAVVAAAAAVHEILHGRSICECRIV